MITLRRLWLLCLVAGNLPALVATPSSTAGGLAWDTEVITASAQPGQQDVVVEFGFHNRSGRAVTITAITPSCGCTLAASNKPTYAPGEKGVINARVEVGNPGLSTTFIVVSTDEPQIPPTRLELRLNVPASPAPAPTVVEMAPIVWDSEVISYPAPAGAEDAVVHFRFRNVSSAVTAIYDVGTNCGCIEASIPRTPWILQPGEAGEITVTANLRGIFGDVQKTVLVKMPGGTKNLRVQLHVPDPATTPGRMANLEVAKADRQAVFKGTCATCHAEPLVLMGASLYEVGCKICHEPTKPRAPMVPSLAGRPPASADYWRSWITAGRDGTLMPAFARELGGPLTEDQIDSLVQFLATAKDK